MCQSYKEIISEGTRIVNKMRKSANMFHDALVPFAERRKINMKRICFFSIPLFGHVNYGLKLAKKLQQRGCEIVYYSGSTYKTFIESKGIKFHNYSKEIESLFCEENSTYNNDYMRHIVPEKMDHLVEWYNFCSHLYKIREIFMKCDIFKMKNPDLIIYDSAALWGKDVSEYFKIKSVASCTPYYYPEKYQKREYSEFVRLILQKKYDEARASRLVYMLEKSLNGTVIEPLSPTADYRIIYSDKSFQLGSEYIDDNTFFIGPLIDDEEFDKEEIDIISKDKPNIYISFGSIYNNANIFRKIVDECRGLDCNFILNIGNNNEISDFCDLTDNWHVVKRINQIEVLDKVQVFVSHGGVNSVREAMYFGVPIVVIPAEGDTLCSANDIDVCKVGIKISDSRYEDIGKAISEVLNNNEINNNCKELSKKMKRAGGLEKAIDIVFKVMEGKNA